MNTSPRSQFLALVVVLIVFGGTFSPLVQARETESTPVVAALPSQPAPQVTNVDTVPPLIDQAPDVIGSAVDGSGAVVTWPIPAATDETDGPVPVACNPGSGSLFPLGTVAVTCSAQDSSQNRSSMTFFVTVLDQTPPIIAIPAGVVVDALDAAGAVAVYPVPSASDNVDGVVPVWCDWGSGAFFPVGATLVTCSASDAAGNVAIPVAFYVTVNPPPAPVPVAPEPTSLPVTPEPTLVPITPEPTLEPVETETPSPTVAPTEATPAVATAPVEHLPETSSPTATATPSPTPYASPTVAPSPTATMAPTPTPERAVPPMLDLPWPLPGAFAIDVYGGPLNGLQAIWGNVDYPITQEFGHTGFSIAHFAWYAYGTAYGLDGFEHPGLDIGMPAGTWLYSPVNGRVVISGDSPYYTYYGNGAPNVGELLIVTDSGDEVVLGHMGRIAVNVGDYVTVGQFIGLSGGDNGDHLHLEVRAIQPGGWYLVVDPRSSFLIDSLAAAAEPVTDEAAVPAPLPLSADGGPISHLVISGPRTP